APERLSCFTTAAEASGRTRPSFRPAIFLIFRSGPPAARLDLTAVDPPGELRLAAGCEDARLLDPVLPLDSAAEFERLTDPVDIGGRPVRDLLVGLVAHA